MRKRGKSSGKEQKICLYLEWSTKVTVWPRCAPGGWAGLQVWVTKAAGVLVFGGQMSWLCWPLLAQVLVAK